MRIVLSLSEIPADVSGKRDIVGVDLNEVNVHSGRSSNSCQLVIGPDPNLFYFKDLPRSANSKKLDARSFSTSVLSSLSL